MQECGDGLGFVGQDHNAPGNGMSRFAGQPVKDWFAVRLRPIDEREFNGAMSGGVKSICSDGDDG